MTQPVFYNLTQPNWLTYDSTHFLHSLYIHIYTYNESALEMSFTLFVMKKVNIFLYKWGIKILLSLLLSFRERGLLLLLLLSFLVSVNVLWDVNYKNVLWDVNYKKFGLELQFL